MERRCLFNGLIEASCIRLQPTYDFFGIQMLRHDGPCAMYHRNLQWSAGIIWDFDDADCGELRNYGNYGGITVTGITVQCTNSGADQMLRD